jgi:hypothetical protein
MERVLELALRGKAPQEWKWAEVEAWRLCLLLHPGLFRLHSVTQGALRCALWAIKLLMFLPAILLVGWWIAVGISLATFLVLLGVRRLVIAIIAAALVTSWLLHVRSQEETSTTAARPEPAY